MMSKICLFLGAAVLSVDYTSTFYMDPTCSSAIFEIPGSLFQTCDLFLADLVENCNLSNGPDCDQLVLDTCLNLD